MDFLYIIGKKYLSKQNILSDKLFRITVTFNAARSKCISVFKIFFVYISYVRFESRRKISSARKYISVQRSRQDGWSSRTGKEKHCVYCLSRHTIYSYLLIARKDIAVTIQGWQRFLSAFFLPSFFLQFSSSNAICLSLFSSVTLAPVL